MAGASPLSLLGSSGRGLHRVRARRGMAMLRVARHVVIVIASRDIEVVCQKETCTRKSDRRVSIDLQRARENLEFKSIKMRRRGLLLDI